MGPGDQWPWSRKKERAPPARQALPPPASPCRRRGATGLPRVLASMDYSDPLSLIHDPVCSVPTSAMLPQFDASLQAPMYGTIINSNNNHSKVETK